MITTLSITSCLMSMLISWLVALGKLRLVYMLTIINGCLFVGLNGMLALPPGQEGVAILIIPSAWMILTACVGLLRLANQSEQQKAVR